MKLLLRRGNTLLFGAITSNQSNYKNEKIEQCWNK